MKIVQFEKSSILNEKLKYVLGNHCRNEIPEEKVILLQSKMV